MLVKFSELDKNDIFIFKYELDQFNDPDFIDYIAVFIKTDDNSYNLEKGFILEDFRKKGQFKKPNSCYGFCYHDIDVYKVNTDADKEIERLLFIK